MNDEELTALACDLDAHPNLDDALRPSLDEIIHVTILLRNRSERLVMDDSSDNHLMVKLEDYLTSHPDDREKVLKYIRTLGLEVLPNSGGECTICLRGTRKSFEKALEIHFLESPETHDISYHGEIKVPSKINDLIIGTSGLCTRNYVNLEIPSLDQFDSRPYSIDELRERYNFPKTACGKGQVIAILGLGGGFFQEDMEAFWTAQGLETHPKVTVLGENTPCDRQDLINWMHSWRLCDSGATYDGEVSALCHWTYEISMNLQIASALAPEAQFYFLNVGGTPGQELDLLIRYLAKAQPDILVGSFGFEERIRANDDVSYESNDFSRAFNHVLQSYVEAGGTALFSSGNLGSNAGHDNLVVTFPASSPHVIAVGGELINSVESEIKTNDAWQTLLAGRKPMAVGGGISRLFAEDLPWQEKLKDAYAARSGFKLPEGRGMPDFSMLAKNELGPRALIAGKSVSTGGTSLAAQLAAGMFACIRGELKDRNLPCHDLHRLIYHSTAIQTFTSVDQPAQNWMPTDNLVEGPFTCKPGDTWNPCVGLGSPNAGNLLAALIEMASKSNDLKHDDLD